MRLRFNPPPNWPPVPPGWSPPSGWSPDPDLPALPVGWQLWVEDNGATTIRPDPVVADPVVADPVVAGPVVADPVVIRLAGSSPPAALQLGTKPHAPQRKLAGLVTFFVIAALAGLLAGLVATMVHHDQPQALVPPNLPLNEPAGASGQSSAQNSTTPEDLSQWAQLIQQPVKDLVADTQQFGDAVKARDPAGVKNSCTAIQGAIERAQLAGPAPDLGIATTFSQALGLYSQGTSTCLQAADSLDPAQLSAAASSMTDAVTHLTSVGEALNRQLR